MIRLLQTGPDEEFRCEPADPETRKRVLGEAAYRKVVGARESARRVPGEVEHRYPGKPENNAKDFFRA